MLFYARLHRSPSRFTPCLGIKVRHRYIHTTRAVWQDRLDSLKVEHSNFLSSASSDTKWKDDDGNGVIDNTEAEMKELKEGEGKLLPTSSHLFKLILPIDKIRADWSTKTSTSAETNHPPRRSGSVPTVLLLHPSQPLSHLSRLILASLSRQTHPESLEINFKSSPASGTSPQYATQFQWSDSTDIGDFIRDAASAAEFLICVTRESEEGDSSSTTTTTRTKAAHRAQGKETVIPT
ncbi:hypothetical protein E1B28_006665 [Marasmius oreades]|uniref:Uncharacterized protein n=1 Tax=Marasmius oreades TaxID=181124 RepID=A0A9P8AA82_9AGAR|nr:uncharacterized protein E1B28_006665 [Marasmius oreades]KAG7095982.1 hypothetical protein E1B28_006665 [Marasmius oreades]